MVRYTYIIALCDSGEFENEEEARKAAHEWAEGLGDQEECMAWITQVKESL